MTRLISILLVVCFICVGVANATPTRFPNGITDVSKVDMMGDMKVVDPTSTHMYFNDFDQYVASDWTITTVEAGTGSATEALTDIDDGAILITNAAGDNDYDLLEKVGESFELSDSKPVWYEIKFKAGTTVAQMDLLFGLVESSVTSPLGDGLTDGIYFTKDDGDANIDFNVTKDSTSTSVAAVGTLSDDTYKTLGFYYDGSTGVEYWVDGVHIGTAATTNLPDDEELTVVFGIQNGEAVAKTLTVEYIMGNKNR